MTRFHIAVSQAVKHRFDTTLFVLGFKSASDLVDFMLTATKPSDRLTEMFERQKRFFDKFNAEKGIVVNDETTKAQYSKEYILALVEECVEVLRCIPRRKLHSPNSDNIDTEMMFEELIDCFKYLLTLFIIQGGDAAVFYEHFMRKSMIVEKRFERGERGEKENEKI